MLGHNKPIPNLTTKWLEILVQNIIFSEDEFFLQYVEIVDSIKSANIEVKIEKQDEIIIPASEKIISYQYATIVEGEEVD